jgi:Glyoxalase/Bleomycin resistance protein/Dioxygenase superfamily
MSATSIFERITKGTVAQMCYVTNDLDHAVEQYSALLGGPTWTLAHIDGIQELTYRGQPAAFTFDQALAQFGGMMMEFIAPGEGGENIYTEALAGAPPRTIVAHHMGFDLPELAEYRAVRDELIAAGYPVVQGGLFGETEFSYFDTRAELGVFLELLWLDGPSRAAFNEIQGIAS